MSKKYRIFIDGESGTTGLQIRNRLNNHDNIEIISIDNSKRKDQDEKLKIIKSVDVTVLCLPDQAARETVLISKNIGCRILDASSAHRVDPEWVFGIPELDENQRDRIRNASLVSNPGCYSTGAILMLRPLVDAGYINPDELISVTAVSGYSGGGNKLIERYEDPNAKSLPAYEMYGLDFNHKHTPEIQKWSCLNRRPMFIPGVGFYKQGMLIQISLDHHKFMPHHPVDSLYNILAERYADERFIQVIRMEDTNTCLLTPHGVEGSNNVQIYVRSSTDYKQTLLVAKLDNLGKGASGAAVQNLNVMLGLSEDIAVELY